MKISLDKLNKVKSENKDFQKSLGNLLGFKPKNVYLYKLAFSHKSNNEGRYSYERLEYLGDAVLNLIVADILYKKYPFKDEGFLTNLRSKIVCGKNLSKISLKLGLDKFINVQVSKLTTVSINSIYCDVFEALIGAIYIDKGFKKTKKIVERIIDIHIDIDKLAETETNFKSRLLEWGQKEKREITFQLKDEKMINSTKQYTVEVLIDGTPISEAVEYNIKDAEQLAAEKAMEILRGNQSNHLK